MEKKKNDMRFIIVGKREVFYTNTYISLTDLVPFFTTRSVIPSLVIYKV